MIERLRRLPDRTWTLAILLLAFGLRMHDLARAEFWTDEAVSIQHVRMESLPALADSLARNEGMPPLYFLGLYLWHGLGESELVLRFPSVLIGVVGVALMAVLGRRIFRSDAAGLLGAAIVAVSSIHITMSQWTRPYALALGIATGLLILALKLGRDPNRRTWILYGLVASAALYTLYILGAMLLGTGLYIWYKRRHLGLWRGLRPVIMVGLGVLAAFLPWLPVALHQGIHQPQALWWVPPPQPWLLVLTLSQFTLAAESRDLPVSVVAVVVAWVVVLLLLGAYRARKSGWLSFTLLTTLVPLALIWVVSHWKPVYVPRHVAFALPGVALLLAEGLLGLKPVFRSVIVVALLGTCVVAQATPFINPGYAIPWSHATEWIASHAQPGDLVVFSPPFQQPAFDIKYKGPPLEKRGIGEYESYVRQPDAVLDWYTPLEVVKGWVNNRLSFWLLEDTRWPTNWGDWEYRGSLEAEFPSLRIYLFKKRIPTNGVSNLIFVTNAVNI